MNPEIFVNVFKIALKSMNHKKLSYLKANLNNLMNSKAKWKTLSYSKANVNNLMNSKAKLNNLNYSKANLNNLKIIKRN